MGFSLLTYEMTLTRVCSALFSYHFSFLAVSLALLGMGLGGLWLSYRPLASLEQLDPWFGTYSLGICAFMLVSFLAPIQAKSSFTGFLPLVFLMLLGTLPFVCCGVMVCVFLSLYRARAGRVYACDLAGGAVACLTVNLLLDSLGPVLALLLSALCGGLAGWLASERKLPVASIGASVVVLVLLSAQLSTGFCRMSTVSFGVDGERVRVDADFWNCLSRVSVILHEKITAQFVIDAGADTWVDPPEHSYYYASEIAFGMRPGGRFTVIGPGAGPDVLMGTRHHPSSFDLVEINRTMINLIQGPFNAMSGGLYRRPEMSIHIGDGRSFMDRTQKQFDVLVVSLVDTYASVSGGAYALTENYVYTVDSLVSYLNRVAPNGIVAITRWNQEAPRLIGLARRALERMNVKRPQDHMFMVLFRKNTVVTLLIKPQPWTPSTNCSDLPAMPG